MQAQCIEVTLQPGDALFLPEGWWHQVDSEGTASGGNKAAPAATAVAALAG
jgi:ribosomal protein L16 Arg81 hydroxylase